MHQTGGTQTPVTQRSKVGSVRARFGHGPGLAMNFDRNLFSLQELVKLYISEAQNEGILSEIEVETLYAIEEMKVILHLKK